MAGPMSTNRPRVVLHLLRRGVPASVLLWAGLAKALDHQAAVIAVDANDVLPDAGVRVDGGGAGAGVSWFEILRDLPIVLAGAYLAVRPQGPVRLDAYFEDCDPTDPREEDDGERIPHVAEARAQADQG
jgi:hypothetical protein